MSATEIITALPKLSRDELEQVEVKLQQLLQDKTCEGAAPWGEALREVAGTARGLPADFAYNHDHYLHGLPRR